MIFDLSNTSRGEELTEDEISQLEDFAIANETEGAVAASRIVSTIRELQDELEVSKTEANALWNVLGAAIISSCVISAICTATVIHFFF